MRCVRADRGGHAIGQELRLEIGGDTTAAVDTEHRPDLGQQVFQRFGGVDIVLALRDIGGTVPCRQFVYGQFHHVPQGSRCEAPVFLAARTRTLLKLEKCGFHI